MSIYFDHSATTPVDNLVLEAMQPFWQRDFGNASSLHGFGQTAAAACDQARAQVADALAVLRENVIFTSGATEANNLAIVGLIKALALRGGEQPHIITSAIEHDAVREPCLALEREKSATLTYLPVNRQGLVNPDDLAAAINERTALVTVMYANSEVGSIQPLAKIGRIIKKTNEQRQADWEKQRVAARGQKPPLIYFHSDATQAVNFLDCRLRELGLDMLSLSAHKIYGPKGVGALAVGSGVPLTAIVRGGHHEKNLRSGTLNVPGIVGLGAAIELAVAERETNNQKIKDVRDYLIERVTKEVPQAVCNTDQAQATPSHAHFSFLGAEGESILMALDMEAGIAVSTGSACASNTLKASTVLTAMGIKVEDTHGAIRFTLGKHSTRGEVDKLMEHLPDIVKRFRDMAPAY